MLSALKSVYLELKKVAWPSRKEMATLLLFTLVFCVIISLMILGLDVLFIEMKEIILAL